MKELVFKLFLGALLQILTWDSSLATMQQDVQQSVTTKEGKKGYIYSVVIDAGCWTTRVAVYGFSKSLFTRSLKLQNEFFRSVSPGLSAYAQFPQQGMHCLDPLLNEVRRFVPQNQWHDTPLVLMANSGLQRLPLVQIDNLLETARDYCTRSPFKVGNDSVTVLDGKEEGLLSWFAVNFLLERFKSATLKTVVSLEMGPDYLEAAFVPDVTNALPVTNSLYYTNVMSYYNSYNVYSRSFWGLGIYEARHRILQKEISPNSLIFISSCINPSIKTVWRYNNTEFKIKGSSETTHLVVRTIRGRNSVPIVDMEKCLRLVRSVLEDFEKPPPTSKRVIYATGVFYDIVRQIKLVSSNAGSKVQLRQIYNYAKFRCAETDFKNPFLCLDSLYVYGLFRYFFDYPESEWINIVRTVYGHTVDWTLAAAYLNLHHRIIPRDKFNNKMLNAW